MAIRLALLIAGATFVTALIAIIDSVLDRRAEEIVEYAPGKFVKVGGRR